MNKSFAILLFPLMMLISGVACAQSAALSPDTIDLANPPEDYVIASLVVADPGDVLYSRVGHVGLRMQCPTHQLDFVFSYEAEPVKGQVLRFLAGKLKMGLFAIPTAEYLQQYAQEGRGVKEFLLNMPIAAKQNLWRILDNHMMEGSNLPYDYITHGCAHSALMMLKEGLDTIPIEYGPWPEKYQNLTRRELTEQQMRSNSPWTWCFLNLIGNGSIDRSCPIEEKVIMPADLVSTLQTATVQGRPLLASSSAQLLPSLHSLQGSWLRPWMVALLLLIATVVCVVLRYRVMDYVLLSLQTILGLVTCYLVCCSSLCCTEWSWLIIPFNILPAIAWRWRRYWAKPYAVVLLVWAFVMAIWPHHLTDPAYIVLADALAIMYWFVNTKRK